MSSRAREIATRRALGARPFDVLRLVMVGMGTAIGLAIGFGVERLLKSALLNTGGNWPSLVLFQSVRFRLQAEPRP